MRSGRKNVRQYNKTIERKKVDRGCFAQHSLERPVRGEKN